LQGIPGLPLHRWDVRLIRLEIFRYARFGCGVLGDN
jgi:hypothetical protein